MDLADLQARIEATFGARDRARGVDGTFRWWVEEVGEVAKALRSLERAAARFADGCPRCHQTPCVCPPA